MNRSIPSNVRNAPSPLAAKAISVILSTTLILSLLPAETAFADKATEADSIEETTAAAIYDKADYYEADEVLGANATSSSGARATTFAPMQLSDEMKYFAKFESSCDYDKGFSRGDDYHALGYYQFDHRYGLQNFLIACYEYDPVTFQMFAQFKDIASADFKYYDSETTESAIRHYDEDTGTWGYTDLGNALNTAWHDAYAADPETFAGLQDSWAYTNYYIPAENYMKSIGIDISERSDCVKGLCWGLCNLFGSSGWKKFVGGVSSGYDWDGVYHNYSEGYVWPGCGLTSTMTDVQFVTALCNYVIDNVSVFYKAQPQYHEGWQNRYKKELAICLEYLSESTFVDPNDWYVVSGAYAFVTDNGIMGKDLVFEPYAPITRGLLVTMLWRCSGAPACDVNSGFIDINESAYYADAVAWAASHGIAKGDGITSKFRPDNILTRQELAVFLHRYAEMRKFTLSEADENILDSYADSSMISAYANEAFAWCISEGLLSSITSEEGLLLDPSGSATQAEAASITMALYDDVLCYPDDVNVMDWYVTAGYLDFVINNGIMIGDNQGNFNPYGSITRAQAVTILYRYDQEMTADTTDNNVDSAFSDVSNGSWYAAAIQWASDSGIVSGYPNGAFLPNRPISRQELATVIARYAGYKAGSYDEDGSVLIPGASDEAFLSLQENEKVSSWARESMIWCAANGIITGVGVDGVSYLMPEKTAARSAMAKIITLLDALG